MDNSGTGCKLKWILHFTTRNSSHLYSGYFHARAKIADKNAILTLYFVLIASANFQESAMDASNAANQSLMLTHPAVAVASHPLRTTTRVFHPLSSPALWLTT
ncbi:hypothetical protein NBRC116583_31310 [Arenicella sp. 4NH20-0111]